MNEVSDIFDSKRMIQRKRRDKQEDGSHTSGNYEAHTISKSSSSRAKPTNFATRKMMLLVMILAIASVFSAYKVLNTYNFMAFLILVPTFVCLGVALWPRTSWQNRLLPLTWVVATASAHLPQWISAGIAGVAIATYGIISRPVHTPQSTTPVSNSTITSSNNGTSFLTLVVSITLMVSVLLTENFMIWVIASTYTDSHNIATAPYPLQDNGHWLLEHTIFNPAYLNKTQVVQLRRLANVQWGLVACLAASFVHTDLFRTHSLYGVGSRGTATLAFARACRTISFALTVLPHPHLRDCYNQRHYPNPPPPVGSLEWFKVGVIPAKYGGCNDLIISGHATVITTFMCMVVTVGSHKIFTLAVVLMVIFDFCVEIYEGFHYSVDMWLGGVLVTLIWKSLRFLEGEVVNAPSTSSKSSQTTKEKTTRNITASVYVQYIVPAVVAYMQLVLFPLPLANYMIVLYMIVVILAFLLNKNKADLTLLVHWQRHMLFCLLYMALGVYL